IRGNRPSSAQFLTTSWWIFSGRERGGRTNSVRSLTRKERTGPRLGNGSVFGFAARATAPGSRRAVFGRAADARATGSTMPAMAGPLARKTNSQRSGKGGRVMVKETVKAARVSSLAMVAALSAMVAVGCSDNDNNIVPLVATFITVNAGSNG